MRIFYIDSIERMARKGNVASVSTEGKPTEKTMAPQHASGVSGQVMDGIVRGIARGTHTHMVDGLLKSACEHKMGASGIHGVQAPATKNPLQNFGSVPFADAKYGGGK